jgi:hypothetical protein
MCVEADISPPAVVDCAASPLSTAVLSASSADLFIAPSTTQAVADGLDRAAGRPVAVVVAVVEARRLLPSPSSL